MVPVINFEDFLQGLNQSGTRTLKDILQVNDDNNLIDYGIRIMSIPILGTLFIALRRKFERRFRH